MSKRGASKPLDYDNWDAPDEPSEPEVFQKADEATIKARNIIIPRRRSEHLVTQSKRGLFKSLDVFGSAQAQTTSNNSSSNAEPRDEKFLADLAQLNKEVSAWINKHVSENPCCILTPIFDDYSKHLASLEAAKSSPGETFQQGSSQTTTPVATEGENALSKPVAASFSLPKSTNAETTSHPKPFTFNSSSTTVSSTSNGFDFSFAPKAPSSEPANSPVFSFGLTNATNSNNATAKPPLFTFTPKPAGEPKPADGAPAADQAEDEEYVPPKPEVKEIKEEGSVYTVRCKLFYKKASEWTERGLGNLHIIPSGEGKFQLLIRADTNLGNILLNIMINKDIPMQVQKNNVTLACVPLPPLPGAKKQEGEETASPPRPVPMLIRVKNAEVAEALMAEIDKHRGKK